MRKYLDSLKKCRLVHNNFYDYSQTEEPKQAHDKIKIICPIHGEFWQTLSNHLHGQGCPKCVKNYKLTTDEFIKRAKKIHGDKYDYSKVNYINYNTKICIICHKHGEFLQTPDNHLHKCGCPKCFFEKESKKKSSNLNEFVKKAQEIHGNKYDYSNSVYKNNHIKICIICPKHGKFWQTPNKHLLGHGCIKCNFSKLEDEINKLLIDNKINFITQYNFLNYFYDFYIPKYNILIECQGEQHFIPVDFSGKLNRQEKIEVFKEQLKRDEIKFSNAINNNFNIIYYSNNKYFHNKIKIEENINYKGKILFYDKMNLMNYIKYKNLRK